MFEKVNPSDIKMAAHKLASSHEALEQYEGCLLINENFIGPQLGQYDYGESLYGLSDSNPLPIFIEELREKLGQANIELCVIASTRLQSGFVRSTYLNLIADGYDKNFQFYFNSIKHVDLNWLRFMDKLSAVSELVVLPFELVKKSQNEFINEFAKTIGLKENAIRAAEEKREALSMPGMKIALKVNRLLPTGSIERKKIIRILKKELPKSSFSQAVFKKRLNEQFDQKYTDSNKEMFEKYIDPKHMDLFDKYYNV